jgi:SAM-dependent MidA family methyltransferase
MILANELLDALAVHLVTAHAGETQELYVTSSAGELHLEPGPLSTSRLADYLRAADVSVADGAQWEINLNADRWVQRAGRALAAGGLLIMDYGYEASELYNTRRLTGSLLCYERHTVHSNPLRNPGGQDMTAHVNFTAVRSELAEGGLSIGEDLSQAEALADALEAWRAWTLCAEESWAHRAGLVRSLEGLIDLEGLGRLRWILGVKGMTQAFSPGTTGVPVPTSHALLEDHLALPDPAQLDSISEIDSQWRELWDDAEEP